jgi:hypothetical protein
LSSECGIPVLVIFLVVLGGSIRSVIRIDKRIAQIDSPQASELRSALVASERMLWGLCAFLAFHHLAYDMTVYLIFGLTTALTATAERYLAAAGKPLEPARGPAGGG